MTKPSLTLTVKKGVTVIRDGKRVRPEIGKTFDFTADERDSILGADASALVKPQGEEAGTATAASVTGGTTPTGTPPSAEQSQSKASGGRKKSTAGKSDAENASDGDDNGPDNSEPLKDGEGDAAHADETADDDL